MVGRQQEQFSKTYDQRRAPTPRDNTAFSRGLSVKPLGGIVPLRAFGAQGPGEPRRSRAWVRSFSRTLPTRDQGGVAGRWVGGVGGVGGWGSRGGGMGGCGDRDGWVGIAGAEPRKPSEPLLELEQNIQQRTPNPATAAVTTQSHRNLLQCSPNFQACCCAPNSWHEERCIRGISIRTFIPTNYRSVSTHPQAEHFFGYAQTKHNVPLH